MSDSHWGFIAAAFAVALIVIGGVTLKILLDYRRLKQALAKFTVANLSRDDIA